VTTTLVNSATMANTTLPKSNFFFFYLILAALIVFKAHHVSLREREKIIINLKPHLLQEMSLPHLVSLFPTPPILALLVGKGVTTQAPSNNNNNNNNTNGKRNQITQSQEKFATFNIKHREQFF
jgi:hypothetical protein